MVLGFSAKCRFSAFKSVATARGGGAPAPAGGAEESAGWRRAHKI